MKDLPRNVLTRWGEALPLQPFLDWCDRREAEFRAELDYYPAIHATTALSIPGINPHQRMLQELGWDDDAGQRRLSRWRLDSVTGMGSRDLIERGLDHAGVRIEEVYPDLAEELGELHSGYCWPCKLDVLTPNGLCPWCDAKVLPKRPRNSRDRKGQGRKMTDEQVRAAHVIYQQRQLSVADLAALLWERFGYASPEACACGLRCAFRNLGLPRRSKQEASRLANVTHGLCSGNRRNSEYYALLVERKRKKLGVCTHVRSDGRRCEYIAEPGTKTCGYHNPEKLEQRRRAILKARAEHWGLAA